MKIYTKTGDKGDTGLFGGGRVPQESSRASKRTATSTSSNAILGMARVVEMMPRIDEVLVPVQRDLFALGALLATPHPEKIKQQLEKARIDDARIAELERAIDEGEAELEPLEAFILPGGTPKAAALHVARTVCRRAERRVIALGAEVDVPQIVRHLPQPPVRPSVRALARREPAGRRGRSDLVRRRGARNAMRACRGSACAHRASRSLESASS